MTKKEEKKQITDKDYELIGRAIENIFETQYVNRHRLYLMSFVKGIFIGFGGVIGATIVVALVVWLLSPFDFVPLINDVLRSIESSQNAQ